MLKTNKLVSLGVLSVIGLGLAVAPTVSAANNSNTTTFGYTAGQAGGGDDSDWVLDMPVQVNLTDDNAGGEASAKGKDLPFTLYNAYGDGQANTQYTGNKTVTVKLGQVNKKNISNSNILLDANSNNKGTGKIEMTLVNKDGETITPSETQDSEKAIATLKTGAAQSVAKAGITKTGNFVKNDKFDITLTWKVSQN